MRIQELFSILIVFLIGYTNNSKALSLPMLFLLDKQSSCTLNGGVTMLLKDK
jgi:hypothetical protein